MSSSVNTTILPSQYQTDSGFFSEIDSQILNSKFLSERREINDVKRQKKVKELNPESEFSQKINGEKPESILKRINEKLETINWREELTIHEYKINTDINPEVLIKNSRQQIEYIQELAIRYLRPPTPPAPGEIIINQL
ncbi:hypothetical protein BpHYR1_048826, partial [Brachionus plicatilis]